jgi:hypothetical protein
MVNLASPWGEEKTNAAETLLGAPTVEDRDRSAESLRTQRACDRFEIFRHCGYGSRKMMMIMMVVVGKKKCLSEKSLAV